MNETDCSLEIVNLSKAFDRPEGGRLDVLKDMSFSANGPAIVALMGPNGCGKTTLIRIIAGEIAAESGRVTLSNEDLLNIRECRRAKRIGRVHQDSYKSLASDLTVQEVVSIGSRRQHHLRCRFPSWLPARGYVQGLSKEAGVFLDSIKHIPTRNLSGGQRQLLALLVALLGGPRLILLDEHRASLDEHFRKTADEVVGAFLHHSKGLVLAATHDKEWAQANATMIAQMSLGQVTVRPQYKPGATQ